MNGKVKINQLDNGLRYILAPVKGMKSVTVLCFVKAGTRYELLENNGISHFLEHMVFKGTKKYKTATEIALAVDSVGGSFNAFTAKEFTGFYVKASVEHLDLALSMVSQLVFYPLIPEKELEIEKNVILEEIRMYEDNPQVNVGQLFEETMFKNKTIGWNTLGKENIIKNLKRQDFKDYMSYLYTPNRMVLVIAGGIEDLEKKEIGKYFGENRKLSKFKTQEYNFSQKKNRTGKIVKKTEQCHLVYGYRTFGRSDSRRYSLSVLGTILGGGMSSRLFEEIRQKRGLAYYIGTSLGKFEETGYLAIKAGTKPETYEKVLALINKEFEKICKKKVDSKELKKAKEFIKGHLYLSLEDSMEIADFYGEDLLMEGKIRSVKELVENIEAVSASKVQKLAKEIFVPERETKAMIGPERGIKELRN